ncbi:MAG: DNA-binding protein [Delftia acidovorans]|nr:DNA-binding protein [Delftia acidovorans]
MLKNRIDLIRLAELDREFGEFAKIQRSATPRCGWAKTIRLALGMSSGALGRRLAISAQGVRKLEQAEANGTITLKTLARLAEGMDCEVHYMLVPRTRLVEQVLRHAEEFSDRGEKTSVEVQQLLIESDSINALAELFANLGKRGFW